ncbi:MAG: galactokinase [Chthoniobacter sp.]|jgi:galactokinase|nr:galactokinase [Chthoniobacter sp.]
MHEMSAHAPGRVELLGNHTDYNDGYVLSAAIDRGVTMTGSATTDGRIFLSSATMGESFKCDFENIERSESSPWANYVLGVVDCFRREGFAVGGFRAEIASDLPLGAGLSSSAALEVATATLLKRMFKIDLDLLQLAKLCRKAENEFVGVNCGLLDQVSSAFGKKNHAIFLDCRYETVETIPFPAGVELLITHSGVKHALVGGEYNERRARCFEAAELLGARALRDVTSAQLSAAPNLPEVVRKRAAHVVGENERVQRGIRFLSDSDVAAFGELMFQSHESSRVNFENSTPELDALVAIAREEPGVLGSRLTGGGFGGATVSLIERDAAARISGIFQEKYRARTRHECQTYLCEIADGAR